MSFQIFWEKLDSEVATKVQELLSSHFESVDRPSFLGPIQVYEFDFGSVAPSIEILDVSDPFPEFYSPDAEEDYEDLPSQHSTAGLRDFANEPDGGDWRRVDLKPVASGTPRMTGSASHSFCTTKDEGVERRRDTLSRLEIPRRNTQTSAFSKTCGVAGNVPMSSCFPSTVKSSLSSSSYFAHFHPHASRNVGSEPHNIEPQSLRLRMSSQSTSTFNNPSAHPTASPFIVTDILAATHPGPFPFRHSHPHDQPITSRHSYVPTPSGSPLNTPNSIPSISRTPRPFPNSSSAIFNPVGLSATQNWPGFSPLASTYNSSSNSSSTSGLAGHVDHLCSQCRSPYQPSVSRNLHSNDPQYLSKTEPSSHRMSGPESRGNESYHDEQGKYSSFSPSMDGAQIKVGFSYNGDLNLSLTTELKLDFAGSTFVSLPIRLKITGASFAATAIFAYAQQRINFCFLRPENVSENILRDVHIQSEVGDNSKHVLKNVGKIERFIVEQLRKFIYDHLVFPAYHSADKLDWAAENENDRLFFPI